MPTHTHPSSVLPAARRRGSFLLIGLVLIGACCDQAAAQRAGRADRADSNFYAPTPKEAPAPPLPPEVLDRVSSAVVIIERLDDKGRSIGSASAFIAADGLVYTNRHCIEGAAAIKLNLGAAGLFDLPRLVAASEDFDIAILQGAFPTDQVAMLEWATAPPRPHSPVAVVVRDREGRISASPGWSGDLDFDHDGMLVLSTSASAWMGCSGAPLVDIHGRVVGIVNRLGDPVAGQSRTTAQAALVTDVVMLACGEPTSVLDWHAANSSPKAATAKKLVRAADRWLHSDTEQAVRYYRQVVETWPDSLHAAYNLAWALDDVGRADEASDVLVKLAEARPDDPLPHLYMGHRAFSAGDYAGAIESYRGSLRIRPMAVTWFWLGTAQWWKQDLKAAATSFEQVIRAEPRHTKSWEGLARLYEGLGQPEDAIRVLSRWRDADPENVEILARLASAHLKAGNPEAHAQLIERLTAANPYLANRAQIPRSDWSLGDSEHR